MSTTAITGENSIKITNNHIEVDCDRDTTSSVSFAGICLCADRFSHPVENITIKNNTIIFINTTNIKNLNVSASTTGGINFNSGYPDYMNLIIEGNIILNSPSSGIFIGTSNSLADVELENISIINNIIKDNGYYTNNGVYTAGIELGFLNYKNINIHSNILSNINDKVYAFRILVRQDATVENCSFYDNILDYPNASTALILDIYNSFIYRNLDKIPLKSPNGAIHYISINNNGEMVIS